MAGIVRTRLDRAAFNRPTLRVARELIGKFVVHRDCDRELAGMIIEVEAYKGPRDRASHTHGGRRTQRVEPLWGDGGVSYVYLIYGIHWLLNFSTAGAENPEGVLIRGILAAPSAARRMLTGPGLVTRHLRIGKRLNGVDATISPELWVEDRGVRIPAKRLHRGPRVGIDYAGAWWASRPWRFWIDVTPGEFDRAGIWDAPDAAPASVSGVSGTMALRHPRRPR